MRERHWNNSSQSVRQQLLAEEKRFTKKERKVLLSIENLRSQLRICYFRLVRFSLKAQ